MAKKLTPNPNKCADCIHCVPDITNLSYKGEPILGGCEFSENKFLIKYNYCKNFKK